MKPTLYLFLFLSSLVRLSAQDLSFSQFYNLRASLNPAYTSVPQGTELVLAYRRQWGQVQQGLNLSEADFSARICRFRLFTGLKIAQAYEPLFGYRVTEGAFRAASFVAFGSRSTLHLGLESSFSQRTVNFDKLVFSGQLDPVFGIYNPSTFTSPTDFQPVQALTLGGGAVFRTELEGKKKAFPMSAGIAVRNALDNNNISFLNSQHNIQRFWTGHASISLPLSARYRTRVVGYLSPVFRYDISKTLHRGIGGLIFQMGQFMAGPMYSFQRRLSPQAPQNTHQLAMLLAYRFSMGESSTMSISYQIEGSIGGLGAGAGLANELVLNFDFPRKCVLGKKSKCPTCTCPELGGKGFWGRLN